MWEQIVTTYKKYNVLDSAIKELNYFKRQYQWIKPNLCVCLDQAAGGNLQD